MRFAIEPSTKESGKWIVRDLAYPKADTAVSIRSEPTTLIAARRRARSLQREIDDVHNLSVREANLRNLK